MSSANDFHMLILFSLWAQMCQKLWNWFSKLWENILTQTCLCLREGFEVLDSLDKNIQPKTEKQQFVLVLGKTVSIHLLKRSLLENDAKYSYPYLTKFLTRQSLQTRTNKFLRLVKSNLKPRRLISHSTCPLGLFVGHLLVYHLF